jgi:hypothetical protein
LGVCHTKATYLSISYTFFAILDAEKEASDVVPIPNDLLAAMLFCMQQNNRQGGDFT